MAPPIWQLFCVAVAFVAFIQKEAICQDNNNTNVTLKDTLGNYISVIAVSQEITTSSALLKNEPNGIVQTKIKPRRRKVKRKKKRKHFKKPSQNLNKKIEAPSKALLVSKKIPTTTTPIPMKTTKKRKKIRRKKKRLSTTTSNPEISISLKKIKPESNITVIKRRKHRDRCKMSLRGGCEQVCFSKGTTKCGCYTGFSLNQDDWSCSDINECNVNNGGCQSICKNTIGSYQCRCESGFRISQDKMNCEDINECILRNGHGPCQGTCINKIGGYECSCKDLEGTNLAKDGHSCLEDEECPESHGCSHICVLKRGVEFCKCPDGMELSPDWKTCQDINECEEDSTKLTCPFTCINTIGSYYCQNPLNVQNEQGAIPVTCNPLYPPSKGFYSCSRKAALPVYSREGRKRVINGPGTVCILVCPKTQRILGHTFLVCGSSGKWEGRDTGKCVEVE